MLTARPPISRQPSTDLREITPEAWIQPMLLHALIPERLTSSKRLTRRQLSELGKGVSSAPMLLVYSQAAFPGRALT